MSKTVFPCAGTTRILSALFLALLVASILLPPSVTPAGAAGAVVSQAWIPLDGLVFDPETASNVTLAGNLHVVTRVTFNSSNIITAIYANLPADISAVSASNPACTQYVTHGASSTTIALPPSPILPPSPLTPVLPNFLLFALPPQPVHPARPNSPGTSPIQHSVTAELRGGWLPQPRGKLRSDIYGQLGQAPPPLSPGGEHALCAC